MTIHKEGKKPLFYLLITLFLINAVISYLVSQEDIQNVAIAVSILFYLLVLQFFRSPAIVTKEDPNLVYAPADGKVVVVEKTLENEYFKDERIQVSIFMSPLNAHVNRTPAGGIISYFKYHPGKYLVAWHPKSSTENERTTMVIRLKNNVEILVRQVAGAVARRIKWYVQEGTLVRQGQEFGFIKFGSRLDVYLPIDAELKVKPGDKTTGGKTVIAMLNSV